MSPQLSSLLAIVREQGEFASSTDLRSDVSLKGDGSVVTGTDVAVERALRKRLPCLAEGTSFWGEELGWETIAPAGIWLVDPIDGTSNYASGNPLWGISVALQDSVGLRLGCIVLPELGFELCSERGGGAYWNGERLPFLSATETKPHELISVNDSVLRQLDGNVIGKPRLCGAFVVDGAFTVRRWFKSLYGVNEKLYDVAATVLAAREIGLDARYCDGSNWNERDLLTNENIRKPWEIGFIND
jgi:fructose-1,6-bisphosphatase/inositol monophosphatase family enzyme